MSNDNFGIKSVLGEQIKTQKGYAFKSPWYSDDGTPIVKVSDFTDSSIDTCNLTFIPDDIAFDYLKYRLETGDTIIQTVGSWPNNPKSVVGKVIKVPPEVSGALLNQNAVKIIPNKTLDRKYIFYLLKSDSFKDFIINCAQGAASQASITLTDIKNYPFLLPPLPTQQKIAAILSAYDDLIENNTRRIKILEEMAQALYREWFVKFRFPGHETVKMVESELGMVPEVWEVVKLGDISDINISSIKKGDKLDEINYIDISSVSTGQIDKVEKIIFSEAPSRARRIVKHEDIIWSTVRPNRKSYSMILNPIQNLIVSTGFAVISAIKTPYTYLYFALTTDDFVGYLTNRATGAAYPAVNSGDFKKALVLLPPNPLLESFHDFVADFFDNRQKLHQKDIILRHARNLLLPKLISGEVDVENIDVQMPNNGGA